MSSSKKEEDSFTFCSFILHPDYGYIQQSFHSVSNKDISTANARKISVRERISCRGIEIRYNKTYLESCSYLSLIAHIHASDRGVQLFIFISSRV